MTTRLDDKSTATRVTLDAGPEAVPAVKLSQPVAEAIPDDGGDDEGSPECDAEVTEDEGANDA